MPRYSSVSAFSSNTVTRGKTVFQSNVFETSSSLHHTFMLNTVLRDIVNILNVYLNYYIVGDIDTLSNILTPEQYLLLSNTLINMPFNNSSNMDLILIRDSSLKTLATLRGAIFHAQNYEYIEEKYNRAKEKNEILDDVEKLRQYINELNKRVHNDRLFTGKITAITPEVNSIYLIYIKHFGYPENGIFNPIILDKIQIGEII